LLKAHRPALNGSNRKWFGSAKNTIAAKSL